LPTAKTQSTPREGDREVHEDAYSREIIGAAIEVHRELGPGLLESAYEGCLAHELTLRGLSFERQKELPVMYKCHQIDCSYRMDLLVGGLVVVEIKAIDALAPIHTAQILTYLKLSGCRLGLLLNFNEQLLRDGLKRVVLNL
jgi:GxxExxY protein